MPLCRGVSLAWLARASRLAWALALALALRGARERIFPGRPSPARSFNQPPITPHHSSIYIYHKTSCLLYVQPQYASRVDADIPQIKTVGYNHFGFDSQVEVDTLRGLYLVSDGISLIAR